jgi:hypothetical protein
MERCYVRNSQKCAHIFTRFYHIFTSTSATWFTSHLLMVLQPKYFERTLAVSDYNAGIKNSFKFSYLDAFMHNIIKGAPAL